MLFSSFACDKYGCVNGPRGVEATGLWLALHTAPGIEVPRELGYGRAPIGWAMHEIHDAFVNRTEVRFAQAVGSWAGGQPVRAFAVYWNDAGGECFYESGVTHPTGVSVCGTAFFPPGELPMLKALMSDETERRVRRFCK
jgi:hypothetical protein